MGVNKGDARSLDLISYVAGKAGLRYRSTEITCIRICKDYGLLKWTYMAFHASLGESSRWSRGGYFCKSSMCFDGS